MNISKKMSAWWSYRAHKILTHRVQPETSHLFLIRPGANDLGGRMVGNEGSCYNSSRCLRCFGGSWWQPQTKRPILCVCLPWRLLGQSTRTSCVLAGVWDRVSSVTSALPLPLLHICRTFQWCLLGVSRLLCMVRLSPKTFHYRQTSTGMIAWGNDEAWWSRLEIWSHNKWLMINHHHNSSFPYSFFLFLFKRNSLSVLSSSPPCLLGSPCLKGRTNEFGKWWFDINTRSAALQ